MIAIGPGPEPFFADVVDHMADICRADLAVVALADPPRQWISGFSAGHGGEAPAGFDFYACEAFGRSTQSVCDVGAFGRPTGLAPEYCGQPVRAFLSRALVLGGVDIGNLYLAQYSPREWSDFDVRYLERAARLIATHFEARATLAERDRLIEVERELNRQAALYQAVITAMREGVVVHAADGSIIASNPAACRILGLSVDQLHGRTSMDPRWMATDGEGAPLPGERHPGMVTLATGEAVSDFLMGLSLPGGERRWVRINSSPIFGAGGGAPERVVATFVDVTEKRRHMEELSAALKRAEEAAVAKQQFIANISHEIRTPLNGVLGMAQALRLKPLEAEQAQQIDVILDCGRSLMTVLNDTLDISKIESGLFQIVRADENLAETMQAAVRLWTPRAAEAGLDLSLEMDPSLAGMFSFDGVRVRQCVSNLVSNAVKFTASGSVRVSVSGVAAEGGSRISVAVQDTGIGMDEEAIGRLFQPFQQADNSIARRFGGTGLGLSLVKRLAELMDGGVSVESEPGRGSRFVFHFMAGAAEARQPEAPPQAAADAPSLKGLRLLVVDDNRVNRMVVQIFLKRHGVSVAEAVNGREALERLARDPFDVVLMDIHMPEMDGIEATSAIRASESDWSGVPVIALTADAMADDRERQRAAGFDDWLPKPVVEADLVAAIARVAAGRIAPARMLEPERFASFG